MNIKSKRQFLGEADRTSEKVSDRIPNSAVAKEQLSKATAHIDSSALDASRAELRANPFDRKLDQVVLSSTHGSSVSNGNHKQLVRTRVEDNRIESEFVVTQTLPNGEVIAIGSQFESRALEVCELVDDVGHAGSESIETIREKNPSTPISRLSENSARKRDKKKAA